MSSITYYNANSVSMQPVSGWQGIRGEHARPVPDHRERREPTACCTMGPITGVGGTSYAVNYPGAVTTSVYGPDDLGNGVLRLVGSYKNGDDAVHGFLFQGTTADLAQRRQLPDDRLSRRDSTPTSTARWAASRSATPTARRGTCPLGTGHAFLYDVAQDAILTDIVYPGLDQHHGLRHLVQRRHELHDLPAATPTLGEPRRDVGHGYLVDYDSATGEFTHWTSFDYPNGAVGQDFVTHFEGISSAEKGVYTLSADSVQIGSANPAQGSLGDRPAQHRRHVRPRRLGRPELPRRPRDSTSSTTRWPATRSSASSSAAGGSPRTRRRSTPASSSPT